MGMENFESSSAAVKPEAVNALQAEFLASFEDPNPNRTTGTDGKRDPKAPETDKEGSRQGPSDEKPELREAPKREKPEDPYLPGGRDLPPVRDQLPYERTFRPPVPPHQPIDDRNKPLSAIEETITFTNLYM